MNDIAKNIEPEPGWSNKEMFEDETKIVTPKNQLSLTELEVDLNELFPDEESDLNKLFPDAETKLLLKTIQRNKKDLHTMTDHFSDDSWAGNALTEHENSGTTQENHFKP